MSSLIVNVFIYQHLNIKVWFCHAVRRTPVSAWALDKTLLLLTRNGFTVLAIFWNKRLNNEHNQITCVNWGPSHHSDLMSSYSYLSIQSEAPGRHNTRFGIYCYILSKQKGRLRDSGQPPPPRPSKCLNHHNQQLYKIFLAGVKCFVINFFLLEFASFLCNRSRNWNE